MFFAHPFKKPILTEIKKTPLFAENWINVAKVGNRLFFGYHDFGTRLASITGGGMLITYDKDGTLTGNLYFGFLEDDPRFEQLTGTLDTIADDGLDDVAVFAERENTPTVRSRVAVTINDVSKENVGAAACRLCDALTDIVEGFADGGEDDEEE